MTVSPLIKTNTKNIILATDSYKLNHWNQYPNDTEGVYSYFESRPGAEWPYTVFFGLQYILKEFLVGSVVSWNDISEAAEIAHAHFGDNGYFNYQGWSRIIENHGGRLPLRIKAVAEGTKVPVDNVMMTVENTDPACFWLTNAVESLLTHVWYPSTVATLSHETQEVFKVFLDQTADSNEGSVFMHHDFGYRGASSHETAGIGGCAHIVSSKGTDTLPALLFAKRYYDADYATLAFSVAATEHSIMTSMGERGEFFIVQNLLKEYPRGILSVVADSYDIYRFVETIASDQFREQIKHRDGTFVVRPDSVTKEHPRPHELVVWIVQKLWDRFGGTVNSKNFRVLDPHVRVLWGDGIDLKGCEDILMALAGHGFSAENMVFGMGGGLLQKVNRDTQRFAFKASAIKRAGEWHPIHKKTLNKSSKAGRLMLVKKIGGEFTTVQEDGGMSPRADLLETVFENGELVKEYTFDEVRANASA